MIKREKREERRPENIRVSIGYKNIPVSIDDAPKPKAVQVQGERNVVTTISARSAQRI